MANDPNNPNAQISLETLIATLIDNNINYISPARLRNVLLGMAERITPPAGGNGLSVESPLEYDPFSGILRVPAADAETDGYLTKEDWANFNSGSGVQSVTGDTVDNTDPENPVINAASETYVNTRADQARDEAIEDSDTKLALKADLVGGTVPSSQLPSYVDDVLNYANLAAFPVTGETGKIYIANDTNKQYRWTGSAYVQITNGLIGSTSDVPEGINLYFTDARARAVLLAGLSLLTGGAITSTDSALVAFGKLQNQLTDIIARAIVKDSLSSENILTAIAGTRSYIAGITAPSTALVFEEEPLQEQANKCWRKKITAASTAASYTDTQFIGISDIEVYSYTAGSFINPPPSFNSSTGEITVSVVSGQIYSFHYTF